MALFKRDITHLSSSHSVTLDRFRTLHLITRQASADSYLIRCSLWNLSRVTECTSDLGRIIVIHMRLRLTFVMRSVVGVPHRETQRASFK